MKKIGLLILAMMLLAGCTQKKEESTFMLTRDKELYALYNQNGKKLTEYSYKTFEEVKDTGYIVTNNKDEKGFVDLDGELVIKFGEYQTIEAADQMLYASKVIENPVEVLEDTYKQNFFILNGEGKVLHTASEEQSIKKSGLPILQNKDQYTVLSREGQELYRGKDKVLYAYQVENSTCAIVGFEKNEKFYYFDDQDSNKNFNLTFKEIGLYEFMAYDTMGVVLYDKANTSMIYVDTQTQEYYHNVINITGAHFDESKNIILESEQGIYVYPVARVPIQMNSYYLSSSSYIVRSSVIYGPHEVYKERKKTGELKNCQLYPVSQAIRSEIFPVYVKGKGYEFYNFDSKKVIDKTYIEAQPFDVNARAIVKTNNKGYSLINEKGEAITKKQYHDIVYIGSSYYAVYNKSGLYGIIDLEGNDVLPMEYTSQTKNPIVEYNEESYMILNKNGRSYVYDLNKEMEVVFSKEGDLLFNEKGYFSIGTQYYTLKGKTIK